MWRSDDNPALAVTARRRFHRYYLLAGVNFFMTWRN
jgi:hypothetical protein